MALALHLRHHGLGFRRESMPIQPFRGQREWVDPTRAACTRRESGRRTFAFISERLCYPTKLTHHVVAAWLPHWVGEDQIRFLELSGDELTIKTVPLVSARTGQQIVSTLTFERVE